MKRFGKPSKDSVAARCQLTGYWDFPKGGFRCWVEKGIQKVEIHEDAKSNGDAGIERHIAVKPGDIYHLTARVRVARKTGKFKARVNMAARRLGTGMPQVKEFNDAQRSVTDEPVERVAKAVIPAGAQFLSVRVKFHTSKPGEAGIGEIHSMKLERIK